MRTTFDQLLEAGCHFGHLKRKWNPAMAPYIYMERNGIHIIDLNKTAVKIDEAAEALKAIAKSGRKILFVSTKKQGQEVVAQKAQEINMPYITERWAGGMLTNFPTIRKAVKKMSTIDKMMTDGTFNNISKREKLQITRQREKLEKNLGSISDLTRLPSAVFVVGGGGKIKGFTGKIAEELGLDPKRVALRGEEIMIGGDETYTALCYNCYDNLKEEIEKEKNKNA